MLNFLALLCSSFLCSNAIYVHRLDVALPWGLLVLVDIRDIVRAAIK